MWARRRSKTSSCTTCEVRTVIATGVYAGDMRPPPTLPRVAVALAAAALLLAGCDGGESAEPTAPTPTTTTETTDTDGSTTPTPAERATCGSTWCAASRWASHGAPVAATPGVLRAALTELLAGPTAEEEGWGLTTAVPDGVEVLGVDLADGTATVDLSGSFDDGGGSPSMFLRLAQLVHTATQFPTVERVALRLDGEPVTTFSAEGIELPADADAGRRRGAGAAILVESPAPGDEVVEPAAGARHREHVRGDARGRAASAQGGEQLASTFGTATCGTGCRARSRSTCPSTGAGPATLRAFERSAKDGSETKVVEIPLVLR